MARAARAGLAAVTLTDHDTLDAVPPAFAAGSRLGLRAIGGREFSVGLPWGATQLRASFLSPAPRTTHTSPPTSPPPTDPGPQRTGQPRNQRGP